MRLEKTKAKGDLENVAQPLEFNKSINLSDKKVNRGSLFDYKPPRSAHLEHLKVEALITSDVRLKISLANKTNSMDDELLI